MPDVFNIRAITERRIDPVEIVLWCGRLSHEKVGDVVMAIQYAEAGYRVLDRSDVPAVYRVRMDAFRADAD